MATAVKNEREVELHELVDPVPRRRIVERVVREESVTLELTVEEARTLQIIFHGTRGDPKKSRRKHADSMRWALNGVIGVHNVYDGSYHVRINFKNN